MNNIESNNSTKFILPSLLIALGIISALLIMIFQFLSMIFSEVVGGVAEKVEEGTGW